jgi:dTDP-4-dehydrorhamnose 3,5-epimerase
MDIIPLKVVGAYRLVLKPHRDERGFLMRTYDADILARHALVTNWIQETHSFTARQGTIRGLHLQADPHGETKLVRVGQGRVLMVLLDVRRESATFRQWETLELSVDTPELLYAPPGLAMGMCTLCDACTLLYKMDAPYVPTSARTILWNDEALGIPWPIEGQPILSEKDRLAPGLKEFLARKESVV